VTSVIGKGRTLPVRCIIAYCMAEFHRPYHDLISCLAQLNSFPYPSQGTYVPSYLPIHPLPLYAITHMHTYTPEVLLYHTTYAYYVHPVLPSWGYTTPPVSRGNHLRHIVNSAVHRSAIAYAPCPATPLSGVQPNVHI
jgi:hypothetical protein